MGITDTLIAVGHTGRDLDRRVDKRDHNHIQIKTNSSVPRSPVNNTIHTPKKYGAGEA